MIKTLWTSINYFRNKTDIFWWWQGDASLTAQRLNPKEPGCQNTKGVILEILISLFTKPSSWDEHLRLQTLSKLSSEGLPCPLHSSCSTSLFSTLLHLLVSYSGHVSDQYLSFSKAHPFRRGVMTALSPAAHILSHWSRALGPGLHTSQQPGFWKVTNSGASISLSVKWTR